MSSDIFDVRLAGLAVSATCAPCLREPLEVIASQFLDEHRRLLNPRVEDYAQTYRHHSQAIRRIFPVLLKLERSKREVRDQILSEQFPVELPVRKIGVYVLEHELRRTSCTISYQAVDTSRNTRVELAVMPWKASEVPTLRLRFLREAAIAARLRHDGILPISDYGTEAGFCFSVTPLWNGISGHSMIAEFAANHESDSGDRSFSDLPFYRIASQLAFALQYSHSRGTLHNNIRPSSVFVCGSGNAYLRDFRVSSAKSTLDRSAYTSPECSSARADERSDVYSLGVTLYEIACRRFVPEFEPGKGAKEVLPPYWPRRTGGRRIPRALHQLLQKATAILPEDRFQTATAMANALTRLSREPTVRPLSISGWLSKLIRFPIASS